jgi:2-dehydropantoate 2-reductase
MKVLIFGAGVIGTLYGWALSKADNDVTLFVKESNQERFTKGPITIDIYDDRKLPFRCPTDLYSPKITTNFNSDNCYDLLIVCIKHYQVPDSLPVLKTNAGNAIILFFGNQWDTFDLIDKQLENNYIYGSPWGGGSLINNELKGGLHQSLIIGEKDGAVSERTTRIRQLFVDSGFNPLISKNIKERLTVSFVQNAAMLAAAIKANGCGNLAEDKPAILDLYASTIEVLNLLKCKGINARGIDQAKPFFYIPRWLFVPVFKRLINNPVTLTMAENYRSNSTREIMRMYYDVFDYAKELNYGLPIFGKYKADIDRIGAV